MNIILGRENAMQANSKHIVLELDTFRIKGINQPITAFCVADELSLESMMKIEQMTDLHTNLIKNYQQRNWQYCLDAIGYLRGQWDGQLDSFYDELYGRINYLQNQILDDDWDGVIIKN